MILRSQSCRITLLKSHVVYVKAVKCLIYLVGRPTTCGVKYELQCPNDVAEAILGDMRCGLEVIYKLYSRMLSAGYGCRYGLIT